MSKLAELKQSDFIAREPKQARGRVKVERILATSEELLLEFGPDGFSSPMVAEAADIPVASVYQFFPTRHAILRTLAERQNRALIAHLGSKIPEIDSQDWEQALSKVIDIAIDFLNDNPIAMALLLNGSVRAEVVEVLAGTGKFIAERVSDVVDLPIGDQTTNRPEGLEPPRIIVAIVRATLSLGYRAEGRLSDITRNEAKLIATAYLKSL